MVEGIIEVAIESEIPINTKPTIVINKPRFFISKITKLIPLLYYRIEEESKKN